MVAAAFSTKEDRILERWLDEGRSYVDIARCLKRTVREVSNRRYELGIEAPSKAAYPVSRLASILGANAGAIRKWVKLGYLKSRAVGTVHRVVDEEDILIFLADEQFWHLYDPTQITFKTYREWALESRRGLRFLLVAEVAKILCLDRQSVQWRIRSGALKAVRRLDGWYCVRSDWLEEHQRTWGSDGFHRRVFSPEEDAYLRANAATKPLSVMARELGRNARSISNRCEILGLPKPPRLHQKLKGRQSRKGMIRPLSRTEVAFLKEWAPFQPLSHLAAALECDRKMLPAELRRLGIRVVPESVLDREGVVRLDRAIQLHPWKSSATVRGREIPLGPRECEVLSYLIERAGCAVDRDDLCRVIWGQQTVSNPVALLRRMIFDLRRKIEDDPANPRLIVSTLQGYYVAHDANQAEQIIMADVNRLENAS